MLSVKTSLYRRKSIYNTQVNYDDILHILMQYIRHICVAMFISSTCTNKSFGLISQNKNVVLSVFLWHKNNSFLRCTVCKSTRKEVNDQRYLAILQIIIVPAITACFIILYTAYYQIYLHVTSPLFYY